MNRLQSALLAAAFGVTSVASVALHQAQHPAAGGAGILSASAARAAADQDDRGKGHRRHWKRQQRCNNGDRDDGRRDRDDRGCGGNGCYNGNTYGGYGPNGSGYGNGRSQNCGGYGGRGNARATGLIVGVDGNRVTLQEGFSNRITIDDQPALDRQQTGRVYVGRSITAYGYWSNNVFYATSIA